MALCIIAQRDVFSCNYGNYAYGYDQDALILRVAELLAKKRPKLVWLPELSQIAVEHTSLREARAENPVDDIVELMERLWEQAAEEQLERMTPEQKHFVELVDNAPDINAVLLLNNQREEASLT